ncbi:MAG: hypothetical protein QM212_08310, partial [Bacteroidota bacterium]|nr:hypothetical protein [Bacteroidota bacterium]
SKINLISLTGFLDSYTIVTEIELSQLFNDCYKEYSFENLKKQIIVKPIKSKAFIRSNEYNLGQSISPKILLPLLSNYLIENGIEITENIDNANYLININSDTRRGSQTNGICTSFLQISIELKNKSGTIIYSDSKNNLKGLKLNYFDAGMNAYERNLNKIKEDVLNKLIMVINNYKE